jgi:hypothetical protein
MGLGGGPNNRLPLSARWCLIASVRRRKMADFFWFATPNGRGLRRCCRLRSAAKRGWMIAGCLAGSCMRCAVEGAGLTAWMCIGRRRRSTTASCAGRRHPAAAQPQDSVRLRPRDLQAAQRYRAYVLPPPGLATARNPLRPQHKNVMATIALAAAVIGWL